MFHIRIKAAVGEVFIEIAQIRDQSMVQRRDDAGGDHDLNHIIAGENQVISWIT